MKWKKLPWSSFLIFSVDNDLTAVSKTGSEKATIIIALREGKFFKKNCQKVKNKLPKGENKKSENMKKWKYKKASKIWNWETPSP